MKRIWILLPCLAAGLLIAGGCAKPPPPSAAQALIPTAAQPKLPTVKLWIGAEEMIAETAVTEKEMRTGMMFRTNMGENEGMIFVMDPPQQAAFWMKNCYIPLSAAYMDGSGRILELHDFQPQDTNSVFSATANIQYVLETPQGWFQRHNIQEGTVIATDKGSLKKTFLDQ